MTENTPDDVFADLTTLFGQEVVSIGIAVVTPDDKIHTGHAGASPLLLGAIDLLQAKARAPVLARMEAYSPDKPAQKFSPDQVIAALRVELAAARDDAQKLTEERDQWKAQAENGSLAAELRRFLERVVEARKVEGP